jgi:general secretion pathway protein H
LTIDNSRRAGFTLLELIVVIFIISLSLTLTMPSFWSSDRNDLKKDARKLSSTLRYIYDESVGKKNVYTFFVDLESRTWGFSGETESRSFKIRGDTLIQDVVVPSHGEVSQGELSILFGPMGTGEPITIHLQKGDSVYTVMFNHISGRTKILEGYIS